MLGSTFVFTRCIPFFMMVMLMTGVASAQKNQTNLRPPVSDGAREPNLSRLPDGRILMSWTEPVGTDFAVKTAILDGDIWSPPHTVVQADDLFVNWADFPSAVAFANGTWAAHWLQKNGASSYQYDVKVALSSDEGKTWSAPFILHDDRSQSEHGFVSFQPYSQDVMAIWLDAGSYDNQAAGDEQSNAMQLRARTLSADGGLGPDLLLDPRTCTCCQTSATLTKDGDILSVYRDRSPTEVRDIALTRYKDGVWSTPKHVANDGWEINGCPVNGPAIDAQGGSVVVAWFTAADDRPAVNVAFSKDGGGNFGAPVQVDAGSPQGRVDVLMRDAQSAVVSWVEYTHNGEAIMVCAVTTKSGCAHPVRVASSTNGPSIGFPRMALAEKGVFIAWTAPHEAEHLPAQDGTTIRVVFFPLK